MVDQTQESAPVTAQVPGVNPKTADEQSQEAAVQSQEAAVQSQEAEVGTTNPDAITTPVQGSPGVQVGGGKTSPPDNEGMLGFATRLFDTIIKEPLLGKNKKPEIQSGGKVKSNNKINPPEYEGMMGFATRLVDTTIVKPLSGENKKPEIQKQNGGQLKSNGKNMRTRKSQ
jgi:hypothetical protein